MELITTLSLFADSYLFFVHDGGSEASPTTFSDELDGSRITDQGGYDIGYLFNGKSICFGGLADDNQYQVKLFRSGKVPDFGLAQRVVAVPLDVSSGEVKVSTLYEEPAYTVPVPSHRYIVYCLGFNLGKDPEKESSSGGSTVSREDFGDSVLVDHECYQIILVPEENAPRERGVLRGAKDLQAVRAAIG